MPRTKSVIVPSFCAVSHAPRRRRGSQTFPVASLLIVVGALIFAAAQACVRGADAAPARHVSPDKPKAENPPSKQSGAGPVILVDVDTEIADFIKSAGEMIARKDYTGAIKTLLSLPDRTEQCFVPTGDPRRYVSAPVRINELIGRLPPEGIKLYRGLYDSRAERLFRIAAEGFDESALRELVRRYPHTSYGNDALNLLGAILFDRGEFSQAALFWQDIITTRGGGKSAVQLRSWQAILLSRIAVAYHFAGESARSAEALSLLIKKHPQARTVVGGREQNVAAFTRRMLAKPPPVAVARRAEGWPSLAGAPDSVVVMKPCKPVLNLRWTVPGGSLRDNPNVKAALGAYPKAAFGVTASLRNGQVILSSPGIGRSRPVPALIHPVVVGTSVLYRSAAGVVVRDLLTGRKKYQSPAFPFYRCSMSIEQHICYRMSLSHAVEDRDMWTLTAADGKVFAVGRFIPGSGAINYHRARKYAPKRQFADTSVLAAFSMTGGKVRLLWQVGPGQDDTGVVRAWKFMTAPTCVADRLYVPVKHNNTYRLVCLNAENGRLIWDAPIGPVPVMSSRYTGYSSRREGWAGPPAVADGKVFVATNGGVIAAFGAETGQPLWAYQYDSTANRPWSSRRHRQPVETRSYPPNPIVVTKGRVICLPADSDKLLALRADTGKLDWSIDRRGLRNLTIVDRSRLLLSGKGLCIIDATGGKEVWTAKKVSGVHGRPAVTTNAILASGKGEIIRISLKDFSVTRLPVKQPDAILGNLICVNGKLIAANAAGISAYFPSKAPARN